MYHLDLAALLHLLAQQTGTTRYQRVRSEVQQLVAVHHALRALQAHLQQRESAAFPLPATTTTLDPFIFALNRVWRERDKQVIPEHLSRKGERKQG